MTFCRMLFGTLSAIVCVCGISRGDIIEFGSIDNDFEMQFVPIGSVGNAPDIMSVPGGPIEGDARDELGAVDYSYFMGKHEVSRNMIEKADAASAVDGTGGSIMASTFMDPLGPRYSRPEQPANTTWFEAARFVNWLNTSSGFAPAYRFRVQPGDDDYADVVVTRDEDALPWPEGTPGHDPENPFRSRLAKFVLPSLDEWYKAAYYDPVEERYYNYATGSDLPSIPVASGTEPGTAVFGQSFTDQGPADITQAGGLSPFGTMAQGGNIAELQESFPRLTETASPSVWYRGGWWSTISNPVTVSVLSRGGSHVRSGSSTVGFRVAMLPDVTP